MTYIIQRKDRFYVVAYDGLDPLTGGERRRWHPAGTDRSDAESIATRLASSRPRPPATLARGGRNGQSLAPKTVHEAHLVIRNALDLALHRQLVDRNVALAVHSTRRRGMRRGEVTGFGDPVAAKL